MQKKDQNKSVIFLTRGEINVAPLGPYVSWADAGKNVERIFVTRDVLAICNREDADELARFFAKKYNASVYNAEKEGR